MATLNLALINRRWENRDRKYKFLLIKKKIILLLMKII